jgi:3-deoxy-D-manno-octulosonic-acid transferase
MRRLLQERPEVSILFTRDAMHGSPWDGLIQTLPRRGVLQEPAPKDTTRAVVAFLDHWKPDVAVRTGLAMAPAAMAATTDRGLPLVLVDLHLPAAGPSLFWRIPGLARSVLRPVHRLLVAEDSTAQFLRRHGANPERIEVLGHLPDATGALPCNEAERAALAARIQARPVWLALAPSEAEVPIVLAAHRRAMRRAHRLLLILAPAGLDETEGGHEAVAALAEAEGFAVSRRWADEVPDLATEVWVADGVEERALWYRLAPVTFLGQTIQPSGADSAAPGVSPYEPAALGSAILHGPVTGAFSEAYGKLLRAGATLPVRNAVELGQAIEMLQAPDRTAALAHAAWDVASAGAEATDRVLELVFGLIDSREAAG